MGVSAAAAWAGLGQQGAQKSTANPAHWEGLVPRTAYPDKAQIGKHGNCPQVLLNCDPIMQGQCQVQAPIGASHTYLLILLFLIVAIAVVVIVILICHPAFFPIP